MVHANRERHRCAADCCVLLIGLVVCGASPLSAADTAPPSGNSLTTAGTTPVERRVEDQDRYALLTNGQVIHGRVAESRQHRRITKVTNCDGGITSELLTT